MKTAQIFKRISLIFLLNIFLLLSSFAYGVESYVLTEGTKLKSGHSENLTSPIYLPVNGKVNNQLSAVTKIEAREKDGFSYPYYLFIPNEIRNDKSGIHTILIIPSNSGANDDFEHHDKAALKQAEDMRGLAARLKVALLIPAFPRPKTDWQIYTHALDRDSMLTEKKSLKRFDLQLIKMIDYSRKMLQADKLNFDKRIFMMGFSAAGMFSNRFTLLHPERIKAAVFGSPGGWAIAPIESWQNKKLRYPIGIADFKSVSGKNLNMKKLKKVPLFFFLGDQDTNDSVVFRDSYETADEVLIFEMFGKTPLERWTITKKIYEENLPLATLKLYPNVGHSWSNDIWKDVMDFFNKHLND